jgi:hypothetical protein
MSKIILCNRPRLGLKTKGEFTLTPVSLSVVFVRHPLVSHT